ncbi:major facilitator superfamily domain-containing protein 8 [Zophobas morio]|uniref:major facilitator superfamily domain-containing protein 8 n=1 Tax=Zophobas morio TaxID=2755281 RepID=UPI003082BA0C
MDERKADESSWFGRTAKLIQERFKSHNKNFESDLETEQQYKERWRSIYIIYFTMFLISLGFSIIVTGVWPYLDKLDPTAGKEFMGYIVAANPFGQMLFSPLVGWWSNRLGSIRIPLLASLALFTTTSIIYSSLELFDEHRKHWMLWTRFLVGVSSANIAACRSYLSAATRVSERTKAVSMISLAQVLGFIVGPAIQAAVVPLGDEGFWLIPHKLKLNMYTASGWINVIFSLFNMYLFLPHVFKEHKIAGREAMLKQGKNNEKDTWKQHRPNYFATWTLIVAFFVIVFNFMLLETLGTPLTMDQFAWSKADSLKYMGILMSVGAVLAIITFASISPLCKKFSEVKVMIWGGFLFMVLGRAIYIPFNNDPPVMYDSELKLNMTLICDKVLYNRPNNEYDFNLNETIWNLNKNSLDEVAVKNLTFNCGEDLLGCPSSQEWCSFTPAITLTQFIIGYFLTAFGYPIGVTLIQTIFSKLLGPRPQGVWMGLMTGSGCLSRVMGPVFVTHIYEEFGTVWTFGLTAVMMVLCLLWLLYFNKTLIPVEIILEPEGQELKEIHLVRVPLSEKVEDD